MTEWMKFNHSPVERVKDYMRLTQPKRTEWLQINKSSKSISQLLIQYPRLLDTLGMIKQDFLLQFSSISLKYLWTPSLCEKVITYAKSQDPKWEDKLGVAGYKKDDIQCVGIQVLPIILSYGTIINSEGRKVRATVFDALNGFVEVKPVGTNIPQYIDERIQKRNRKQPFVLILGERKHPTQSFVVVEGSVLPAADILEAVEVCLKHITYLIFPTRGQCCTSWEFLQQFVFNLLEGNGKGKGLTSPLGEVTAGTSYQHLRLVGWLTFKW